MLPRFLRRSGPLVPCLLLLAHALPAQTDGETRLLRFPATNGSEVVFSYAGQLYAAGMDGGAARRLTSGPGYAVFPRFSADGAQIAFTAQYDGNTEVYVMPAAGGEPRRLTYSATIGRDDLSDRMGPNNIVMAWKNTRPEVVFRSRARTWDPFLGELESVGLDADLPRPLPVPRGGFCSFSPDDTKMAYNRVFREFRTWKRYRGGQADDIWIFDFKTGALEDITNDPAQDIIPMWAPNGKIYFLSDRDGRMNLFSYELATKRTAQITHYRDYDIKFPSLGRGAIAYEQAGCVWLMDLATERPRRLAIRVEEDYAGARAARIDVSKSVTDVRPSPDGARAVVVARGALYTVPAKDGPVRPLGTAAGVHERDAVWSSDGKWIAYVSDATGENELYYRAQDGRSAPVQLTRGADTYYYHPAWSPDGKKLLWSDRLQRLRFVDVDSKAVTEVDRATAFEIVQYAWSPDSKWIAYARPEDRSLAKVWLYSVEARSRAEATDGWYSADSPAFSDDGKYLLFSSSRDFNPLLSDTELEHAYHKMQRVYLLTLAKATESPLKPRSDEVSADGGKDKAGQDKDGDKKEEPKAAPTTVDLDGLRERIVGLPVEPANYGLIRAVGDKVFYLRTGDAPNDDELAGPGGQKGTLAFYDFKERKETELGEFNGFEITRDGKRMLVQADKDYALIDLPSAKVELKDNKLDFSDLRLDLDRRKEWAQIYDECWRQMRDYFYAPNMNGVDWPAVRAKYAALLPWVRTRYDLTYLLGEMIGELDSGHTYVGGGDLRAAPRVPMGLLGAELSRDPASRAYRVDRILPGENWDDAGRSPLTEIGVGVREGDYILAVNGAPTASLANFYQALVGQAGKQVALRVNSRPEEKGAREVTVVPVADETPLYYHAWVRRNLDRVSARTGGRVGYLHIPDMGIDGLNEFAKHFYPQLRKQALIVDVRSNGGGFVSPMIVERLRRQMVMAELARNATPVPNPQDMLVGPKVTLIDEFSASDGDIFPYRFRTYGLGKLVGKRTWGGVVGIRESLPLADGGFLYKPEFAPYAADGSGWLIESHGVDPDIVVDNDPAREFRGEDQQLDKAIDVVLDELKSAPRRPAPPPPWPDRSGK